MIADDVQRLRALLPRSLADDPAADAFWTGILDPVARVEAYLDAKRGQIPGLLDPAQVPDAVVRYLAALVGLGPDLPAAAGLSTAQLRRLIPVMVRIWKTKGSTDSWRAIIGAFSGARVLILDWFYYRTVDGTSLELHTLPEPGGSGGNYTIPERVSDVWVADPAEALDLTASGDIARLLSVVRPLLERINLYRAFFVEDLRVGLNQWDIETPGAPNSGLVDGGIRSANGNLFSVRADIPDLDADFHALFLAAVEEGADLLVALQAASDDDGYRIRILPATSEVEVARMVGGAATVIASWTMADPITDGYFYRWSLDFSVLAASVEIRVLWEGVLIGTATDTDAARWTSGRVGFQGRPGGSGRRVTTQTALIWLRGVSPVRIGPA